MNWVLKYLSRALSNVALLVLFAGCGQANFQTKAGDEINSVSQELNHNIKSFYPPSKTLKKFAHKNPSCPLWSDWQSLCSYTGEGGGIICHDDPSYRAEPSAPFCAYKVDLTKTTSEELASLQRFCSLLSTTSLLDKAPIRKVKACFQYQNKRPFSGRNMTSLGHKWCNAWITDIGWLTCDGYEDKILDSGIKISEASSYSCKKAISEKIEFERASCAQWSYTHPCANPQFLGSGVNYIQENPFLDFSDESAFDKIIIPNDKAHLPLPVPTLGIFCHK